MMTRLRAPPHNGLEHKSDLGLSCHEQDQEDRRRDRQQVQQPAPLAGTVRKPAHPVHCGALQLKGSKQ